MDSENKVVLTEEYLRKMAVSYIPLREKADFIKAVSVRCFDKMEIGTEDGEALPPFYKESTVSKTKYMMAALMRLYLRIPFDPEDGEDEWSIGEITFDAMAQSFPISQLERIKKTTKDKALQDKIYDMLADYRLLEKLLNAECYGLLPAMNDALSRFQMMMSAQTTPEAAEALLKAVEDTRKEFEEYRNGR